MNAMRNLTVHVAYIGVGLDIEGAASLPEFSAFLAAFRKDAAYKHPLLICALSGPMFWDNANHFKLKVL